MARIIRFNPDPHEETRVLLPWYVTGQLEEDERGLVEAHLGGCAACQAELRLEQRLADAVAELPVDTEQGWSALRERLETAPDRGGGLRRLGRVLAAPGGAGWLIAAQIALALAAVSLVLPLARPPSYHALGAVRPAAVGDVIVIFRPEARTEDLTRVLRANGARLVDGPTTADAYVLDVPLGARPAALVRLRADAAVTLAEPIDPANRP